MDQQGVVIVVPDKRPSDSIGNTLPPITNPLEVHNVNPRIYVELCGNNQTSGGEEGTKAHAELKPQKALQKEKGMADDGDNSTKFNGSETRRTNSENDKLFEEAVQKRQGEEWLRRIKDAHAMQMDQTPGPNFGLGMKRKRVP